jgi:hypothetical protein
VNTCANLQQPRNAGTWWEQAVSGDEPPVHDGEPQAGFFAVRRFRYGEWPQGPFVPARVWWEPGEIDPETGELLSAMSAVALRSTASP